MKHSLKNTNKRILKDAAKRSLAGSLGSGPNSVIGQDSTISNTFSRGQSHLIRMKGNGNRYETHKGSIYQPMQRRISGKASLRSQLKESNNRLRALQELDRRREEQLAKEIAALELRRKQQEEETQKRINLKKVRLAETGPIVAKSQAENIFSLKNRLERDSSKQDRFLALVNLKKF